VLQEFELKKIFYIALVKKENLDEQN